METKIKNDIQFTRTIDQLGDGLQKLNELADETKALRNLLDDYANEHDVQSFDTERFRLVMERGEPSLRRLKDLKKEDVIATLKKSEVGKGFVVTDYDKDALKEQFAGTEEGISQLREFGLELTNPKPHAKVTPLEDKAK